MIVELLPILIKQDISLPTVALTSDAEENHQFDQEYAHVEEKSR